MLGYFHSIRQIKETAAVFPRPSPVNATAGGRSARGANPYEKVPPGLYGVPSPSLGALGQPGLFCHQRQHVNPDRS
ncbi:hypothetical protein NHX12_010923 [Muraenolepis orangiensis]|uniref:Uncharacterized protein n=1 Tax=Muraenolepis orangiensis TaxID=630683 RepID=A0A9Q0DEV7_9TELE|nr:hypothetical protein NHX12_010923 [Muraenolepis orangiensis]